MIGARKNLLDFALILGGKSLSLAVVFLGGLLIARNAGPAEYGIFTVAVTLVLLGDGFIGAPFDMAAVRFFASHPGEEDRARRVEATILHWKLLLAVVVFGSLAIVSGVLARRWPALAAPGFPMLACLLALAALLAARSTATSLQNRRQFRLYSAADVVQGLMRLGGFLVLAWAHRASAHSYLLVYGCAALGVAVFGWIVLRQGYLLGAWPSWEDVRRLLEYSGFAAGIVILATMTGRGDLLILALHRGAGESASYALASQIALLVAQVSMYASVLTQPRVLALRRDGRIRHLWSLNAVMVVPLLVATLGLWDDAGIARILTAVFGPEFSASVPVLRILMVGVWIDWLIVPVVVVFCTQECPGKALLTEAIIAALFLAAGGAVLCGMSPWPAESTVAWISVLGRVAKLVGYGGLFWYHTARSRVARGVA